MIEHKGYTIAPTGNPTPMRWMDYAASIEDGEPCEYFGPSVDDVKRQIDEG